MKSLFSNLWIFFLSGYALIWLTMARTNKKRNQPIEDPEMRSTTTQTEMILIGFVPTLLLFICTFFMPLKNSTLLPLGIIIFLAGVLVSLFSILSFRSSEREIITKGLYSHSRNPMYVGGFFFFTGIFLMGWDINLINFIYIIFLFIWIFSTHHMVKKEELFLENKYGALYQQYKSKTPRYF